MLVHDHYNGRIQNSILVLDSSEDYKIREISKSGNPPGSKSHPPMAMPQCLAFDSKNPGRAYCGTFGNRLSKQMIVGNRGLTLEKM